MTKRAALGKGLGALFPEAEKEGEGTLRTCPIEDLHPSPLQPRSTPSEEGIDELARSIKEKGILQPLVVRKADVGFELIMGERRWLAARRAGLKEVPILVRDASDKDVLEMALIENLQREDLTPLEEAQAYQRMISEFSYTQEVLAQKIGKDRSSVANMLRLLKLPDEIRNGLHRNDITVGHARALLALPDDHAQISYYRTIVKKGLSVRATEDGIRRILERPVATTSRRAELPEVRVLREELQRLLKTQVRVKMQGTTRGTIEVDFYSLDELDRLVELVRSTESQ
jgi:ParB family chromosome partitioning protein